MKKSQINLSKIETEKKTAKRCTLCTSVFIVSNHLLLLKSVHYNLVYSSHDTKIQQTLLNKSYN